MKAEYYLAIALTGVLLMGFGLFGLMKGSHRKTDEVKPQSNSRESVLPDGYVNDNFALQCNRCGGTHFYFISGFKPLDIILPCNGERIKYGIQKPIDQRENTTVIPDSDKNVFLPYIAGVRKGK